MYLFYSTSPSRFLVFTLITPECPYFPCIPSLKSLRNATSLFLSNARFPVSQFSVVSSWIYLNLVVVMSYLHLMFIYMGAVINAHLRAWNRKEKNSYSLGAQYVHINCRNYFMHSESTLHDSGRFYPRLWKSHKQVWSIYVSWVAVSSFRVRQM